MQIKFIESIVRYCQILFCSFVLSGPVARAMRGSSNTVREYCSCVSDSAWAYDSHAYV